MVISCLSVHFSIGSLLRAKAVSFIMDTPLMAQQNEYHPFSHSISICAYCISGLILDCGNAIVNKRKKKKTELSWSLHSSKGKETKSK